MADANTMGHGIAVTADGGQAAPSRSPVAPPRPRGRAGQRNREERFTGYVFILPTVVLFVAFVAWPIIHAIYLSFTTYTGFGTPTFTGLDNFTRMAGDPTFRKALTLTIVFTVATTVLQTVIPMMIAVLVAAAWRGIGTIVRTILFLPAVISFVVTGIIWQLIYDPNIGSLNRMLNSLGLHSLTNQWLGNPKTVIPALLVVSLWQSIGLYMLIFFAGLQGINPTLYEAARVDGANARQRLFHVTIPMLRTVTSMVVTLNLINGLKTFDVVYVMTQGGPNHASEMLSTYLYSLAFGSISGSVPQIGYATAISIVVLILCMVVVVAQFAINRRNADAR